MQPKETEGIIVTSMRRKDISVHEHPFFELAYVTEGHGYHWVDGERSEVKKGDYFIVDIDAAHQYTLLPNENLELTSCMFYPAFVDKILKDCRSFRELINTCLLRFDYSSLSIDPTKRIFHDDGCVLSVIRRMEKEYAEKKTGYQEMLRCCMTEILILTMRQLAEEEQPDKMDDSIRYITEYVQEHYAENVTLDGLGKTLGYSPAYLSNKFKKFMKMPFGAYLQRVRVEKSCRLITGTNKKIIEIAALVGYRDVQFFNHVFKKMLHITPRQFRVIHKN